jgi:hypothetical protein
MRRVSGQVLGNAEHNIAAVTRSAQRPDKVYVQAETVRGGGPRGHPYHDTIWMQLLRLLRIEVVLLCLRATKCMQGLGVTRVNSKRHQRRNNGEPLVRQPCHRHLHF